MGRAARASAARSYAASSRCATPMPLLPLEEEGDPVNSGEVDEPAPLPITGNDDSESRPRPGGKSRLPSPTTPPAPAPAAAATATSTTSSSASLPSHADAAPAAASEPAALPVGEWPAMTAARSGGSGMRPLRSCASMCDISRAALISKEPHSVRTPCAARSSDSWLSSVVLPLPVPPQTIVSSPGRCPFSRRCRRGRERNGTPEGECRPRPPALPPPYGPSRTPKLAATSRRTALRRSVPKERIWSCRRTVAASSSGRRS